MYKETSAKTSFQHLIRYKKNQTQITQIDTTFVCKGVFLFVESDKPCL